jgi:hypothetical protein
MLDLARSMASASEQSAFDFTGGDADGTGQEDSLISR